MAMRETARTCTSRRGSDSVIRWPSAARCTRSVADVPGVPRSARAASSGRHAVRGRAVDLENAIAGRQTGPLGGRAAVRRDHRQPAVAHIEAYADADVGARGALVQPGYPLLRQVHRIRVLELLEQAADGSFVQFVSAQRVHVVLGNALAHLVEQPRAASGGLVAAEAALHQPSACDHGRAERRADEDRPRSHSPPPVHCRPPRGGGRHA